MSTTVILVDDEEHVRRAAGQTLELADYRVECFDGAGAALSRLDAAFEGILVTDVRMPDMDGLKLMQRVREMDPDMPVVLVSGHADIAMAVRAIRDGAYDFIEKPFASGHFVEVVGRAMEKRRLTLENRRLRAEIARRHGGGPCILGDSAPAEKLRHLVASLADTGTDVLIFGETGTGKELIARSLHESGRRRRGNFVALNCGAVPETLMESEIFGHEPGAFTGAEGRRIGKFEHANGGTLFLDEIESMPVNLQVKLLRVLQERAIERLGSNEVVPLDLRVVAATKTDLRAACREGTFREDLYYRLSVVTLDVPRLRERRDDVPLLFRYFLAQAARRLGRPAPPVPPEQMQGLMVHDWPGNVRELQHAAERFILFGDWRSPGPEGGGPEGDGTDAAPETLSARVGSFEKSLIVMTLERNRGGLKQTLDDLGLPRKTFYDKLKKYGLTRREFTKDG